MIKVLIFTDYFFPGFRGGGPIQSIKNLCDALDKDLELTVFTRAHDFKKSHAQYDGIQIDQMNNLNDYRVFYASRLTFISIFKTIKQNNPDVLYLNSFFSTLSIKVLIIKYFFFSGKAIVLAPRGEFSPGALALKKLKKSIYINFFIFTRVARNISFHATDEAEMVNVKKFFSEERVCLISNLSKEFQERHDLTPKEPGILKLVFISRISPKKNLEFAISCLNNFKASQLTSFKIIFDIYGVEENASYLNKCKNLVAKLENIEINFCDEIYPDDIPATLSNYHVFFLPTMGENFGHAIVEAMKAGLIPLISNLTPWTNLQKQKCGWSIPLDNQELFIDALTTLLLMEESEYMEYSDNVRKYIKKQVNNNLSKSNYLNLFSNYENI